MTALTKITCASLVIMLLTVFSNLHGQNYSGLGEAQLDERISFIENHFSKEREKEVTWFWGWFAFMSTVLGSSTALYLALPDDNENKDVQPISMITATLALGNLVLFRPMSLSANNSLAQMPANSRQQKEQKLARAEKMLNKAVFRQRYGKGWLSHIGSFLVVTAGSLVEWLHFDRPAWAAARFVAGMAVGEFKIYTQSTGSIEARKEYRARYYAEKTGYQAPTSIQLAFWGTGAAAILRF